MNTERQMYHGWRDSNATKCPICDSEALKEFEPQNKDAMRVTKYYYCTSCESDWNVVYYMSDFEFFYVAEEHRNAGL